MAGPAHVLIVDDNAELRGAVSLLLQDFAGVIAVVPKLERIHALLAAIQLVGFTPRHPYSNGVAHA